MSWVFGAVFKRRGMELFVFGMTSGLFGWVAWCALKVVAVAILARENGGEALYIAYADPTEVKSVAAWVAALVTSVGIGLFAWKTKHWAGGVHGDSGVEPGVTPRNAFRRRMG